MPLPEGRELAGWLASILSDLKLRSACVLFAGTGRVPQRLKSQGIAVRTLDTLQCHHFWNGALLPDGPAEITDEMVADWMRLRKETEVAGRFFPWANEAFTPEEAVWLGIWRANILDGGLPFRTQALGAVVVMRTMTYWLAWNKTELGHKPLPPAAVFRHYVDEANKRIWQSGRRHEALFSPPGSIPKVADCDLLYCYVPPRKGMKAMDRRLPYWERWVVGDPAAPLPIEAADRGGGVLDYEEDRIAALARLLRAMVEVPIWALAHGGDGDDLFEAVSALRPVTARHAIAVPYPTAAGSSIMTEGLIVAGNAA